MRLRSISAGADGWLQSQANTGEAPTNDDENPKVLSNCSAAAATNQAAGWLPGAMLSKRALAGQNASPGCIGPPRTVLRRCCKTPTLWPRAPHSHATRANVESRSGVGARAHAAVRPRNAKARAAHRIATGRSVRAPCGVGGNAVAVAGIRSRTIRAGDADGRGKFLAPPKQIGFLGVILAGHPGWNCLYQQALLRQGVRAVGFCGEQIEFISVDRLLWVIRDQDGARHQAVETDDSPWSERALEGVH